MADTCDDFFRCLLCFRPYESARELPCLHSFCRRCLEPFTQTESTTTHTIFPCPVCETPTPNNSPRSPVNTWSSFLPLGAQNSSLSSGACAGSESIMCEGCRRDGEDTRATYWCRHCGEAMCSPCRIAHRRNKKTTDHKMVDITDVSKAGTRGLAVPVYEECVQHPHKAIEVYCLDHGSLCCILCLAVSHRECKHVRSIEDVSKKPTVVCDNLWVKLESESKILVNENDESLANIKLDKENAIVLVKSNLDAIRKRVDELQAKYIEDVARIHDKNKQLLLKQKQNTEEFYTNVKNTRLLMGKLGEHVTPHQVFLTREQTNMQLMRHYQRLKHKTLHGHNVYKLEVQMDDPVQEIMNTLTNSVNVISRLSDTTRNTLTSVETLLESIHKTQTVSTFADSMSSSDMIGTLTKKQTRKILHKSEIQSVKTHLLKSIESEDLAGKEAILLTGGTFLDGERLIMADCNNKRLLLFDKEYKYIKQYAINGCPTEVIRGHKDNELYVAVFNKEILRCSFASGHLDVIGRTKCPTLTCGVALLDEKLLAVTTDNIKVLEDDGHEVTSVQIKTTGTTCIGACNQRHLYFHRNDNSVVGRRLDGCEVTRYTHPLLRDPVGICLDELGHVFVCGYQSGNIHEMALDATRGQVLVDKLDKIKHPWAIIVHPSKREIVVSSCKEETAFEVYQILPAK